MFQFPRFAFVSYVFRNKYLHLDDRRQTTEWRIVPLPSSVFWHPKVGFPIRRFTDQRLFAAPRDLSQRTTSFIASQRQGIHRIPLRHLIALIIDAHRSAAASSPSLRRTSLGSIEKTSLLQTHPGTLRSCDAHLISACRRDRRRLGNRMHFLFTI